MRGEHFYLTTDEPLYRGSSPHARGARDLLAVPVDGGGIIPACAGSTGAPRGWPTSRRDHPRMRGEHSMRARMCSSSMGSSPHARGARVEVECHRVVTQDHPRMRGEHRFVTVVSSVSKGSSPHARGALTGSAKLLHHPRIIPACAGSTNSFANRRLSCQGSSPHARGAPRAPGSKGGGPGIIPACAGSTDEWIETYGSGGDHPRMRGEHPRAWRAICLIVGSSPHARGAHVDVLGDSGEDGIIPACAGSTCRLR